ncbi:MAG: methionine biosynthesis protein MetW [Bryobacteraceae bacterium]|jgi:methionine biosynthesis protein MetW
MPSTASDVRHRPFVTDILGRSDYAIISELIEPNSRVLDLGCGEGELLQWLVQNKAVDARGIEIDGPKVQRAIARGVSVYQSDIDEGLTGYPDDSFDYVILSQTLQESRRPLEVLREMLRIGKHAIVAFPNYGHWAVRLSLAATGRAPRTRCFPFEWYNSPNIHFLTIRDFEVLAREQHWTVERKIFLSGHRTGIFLANLMAEVAVYQVRK